MRRSRPTRPPPCGPPHPTVRRRHSPLRPPPHRDHRSDSAPHMTRPPVYKRPRSPPLTDAHGPSPTSPAAQRQRTDLRPGPGPPAHWPISAGGPNHTRSLPASADPPHQGSAPTHPGTDMDPPETPATRTDTSHDEGAPYPRVHDSRPSGPLPTGLYRASGNSTGLLAICSSNSERLALAPTDLQTNTGPPHTRLQGTSMDMANNGPPRPQDGADSPQDATPHTVSGTPAPQQPHGTPYLLDLSTRQELIATLPLPQTSAPLTAPLNRQHGRGSTRSRTAAQPHARYLPRACKPLPTPPAPERSYAHTLTRGPNIRLGLALSDIPHAGWGVFTLCPIRVGNTVLDYSGPTERKNGSTTHRTTSGMSGPTTTRRRPFALPAAHRSILTHTPTSARVGVAA